MNTENLNLQKFKHLGEYRNVNWQGAAVDARVLKTLARKGGSLTRGQLHTWMGSRFQTPEELQASLDRLQEWGMIELHSMGRVDSVKVELTKLGEFWAAELRAQAVAIVMATTQGGQTS